MLTSWPWSLWNAGRIPSPVVHWGREHYIPLKPTELIERLIEYDKRLRPDSPSDIGLFEQLCKRLIVLIHQQYRQHHEQLIRLYDDFDPDLDLRPLQTNVIAANPDPAHRDMVCRRLFSEIADSLHYANYRRLKPREIQEALRAASHWGVRLRIRFSSFRRLEVYARGDIVAKRWKRDWYRLFQIREVDVPIYQRIVLVFRTKEVQKLPQWLDPDCVHVRMFKNIPKADVDMMLPGSQVRLTWMDTGKIGIPTMWGLFVLVSKLAKSIWLLAVLSAVKVLSSFLLVVAIALASIFYGVKSIFSYSTTKRMHQLNVAQNLYFQNLDNNLGALLRMVDEAEQQESCEAIVAYYVMLRSEIKVMTDEQIDRAAETLLRDISGVDVDFDVEDVLRDLTFLGVLKFQSGGWNAMSLVEAVKELEVPLV
jgi:hypothetical protein